MTIGLVIRGKFRWSIGQHVVSQHRLQLTIDYDNETSSFMYTVQCKVEYCRFVLQYVLQNSTLTFLLPGKFQKNMCVYLNSN